MNENYGGINILTVLLIIFIVLKVIGVINWSWWLVFIPLWIDIGIIVIGLLIIGIYYLYMMYK